MSTVTIVSCPTYDAEPLEKAIQQVAGDPSFPVVRDKIVLLKPNILSDAKASSAITTNPAVLRAVIHLLKRQGAKEILVGDSPGLQGAGFVPRASGIADVCEAEGVSWVDFTKDPIVHPIPYTRHISLPLTRALETADVLISLPKFKTHRLMYVTGAAKNQFGLVPSLHKSACHVKCTSRRRFADLIVGINAVAKPAFAIMDAVVGMEGEGPANGNPRHVGLLLGSSDVIALDWAEATIMGYDPLTIPIIASGLEHHLGEKPTYPALDAKDLVITDFECVPQQDGSHLFRNLLIPFLTRPFHRHAIRVERPAPQFGSPNCILCKKCIRICPAHALTTDGKRIVIDTRVCVRCYCCHEVCPANAITIKES
ncbi:MAG: DUF362 domain-containing protein [Sphaerochaeta sp.]|jgi:uncharacterized protein (DUF362 family)/Pyruvate/2-oxoacid:ferredoxin oxidoreductase delta subunit|nr:DUF362 domain-containing protein [Sphaerochaeta sp.]MCI2045818.1 DUF362 domain-containing protein [Sphaerochaeta sp.]MCI2076607.1 DUF362 domain-containing protein [Sphaerochaeta sp.]MCI2097402.1 DUF362 domain-containing protein [Sphaerochaeta sp.]MCI2104472.1 DUF362 domain-containing protein [Sphaerochaeta sp.]